MNNAIARLINKHELNIEEESAVFMFSDAVLTVKYDEEQKSIAAEVTFVDRVIGNASESIEQLIEEDE